MKYEVTKSPGVQFPVGMIIETDNLHHSMLQHVRPLGLTAAAEPEAEPETPPKDPAQRKPRNKPDPDKPVDTTSVDEDDDNT